MSAKLNKHLGLIRSRSNSVTSQHLGPTKEREMDGQGKSPIVEGFCVHFIRLNLWSKHFRNLNLRLRRRGKFPFVEKLLSQFFYLPTVLKSLFQALGKQGGDSARNRSNSLATCALPGGQVQSESLNIKY